MNYFKKEGEADKQAVKKLAKEVSKDVVGQVKKAMKRQDQCSGCTNIKGCITCVNGNMKEVNAANASDNRQ